MPRDLKKNYYQYREKYNHSSDLFLTYPVDVTLEISSICNMRCSYCYHADPNVRFKKNIMWPDVFKTIIKDAARLQVPAVKLNWRGEPTINPYFYTMTKYIKERANEKTFIDRISNTNFYFKHERSDIFEAFANQTKVKISYDSFRTDVFNAQRPGGNHDLITRNITKFYNMKGRNNTIIIQAVRTNLNKDEDLEGELKKHWPSAEISVRDMVEGRHTKDISDMAVRQRDFKNRKPCLQAFARLIFDVEGNATVCCPDIDMKYKLGNISDKTISQLFNCDYARFIRSSLKTKTAFAVEPCKSCSSFESFDGFKPNWDS